MIEDLVRNHNYDAAVNIALNDINTILVMMNQIKSNKRSWTFTN